MKPFTAPALLLALSAPALAGEQLPLETLARGADAVAVVSQGPKGPVVVRWLTPEPAFAPRLDSVCAPDARMLRTWLARHRTHPGRASWKAAVAAGRYEQVVFFHVRDSTLSPWCEAEVMLGETLSTHPAYAANLARIEAARARQPDAGGGGTTR